MNELQELKDAIKDEEMNERQVKVFEYTEDGYFQDEIAGMLEVSPATVSRTMVEIVEIFEPFMDEYRMLVDLDADAQESFWDMLNYDQLKGDTSVDKRGRAKLPMYCAIHPSEQRPRILSKSEEAGRVCFECKEQFDLPYKRDDYPEWAKELIKIEDQRYEKERQTEYFVNSGGLDPADVDEDWFDLD